MQWTGICSTVVAMLSAICLGSGRAAEPQSVFKCVDVEGRIAFQTTRCDAGQTERRVEIAPPPRPAPSPDYGPSPEPAPASHRQASRSPSTRSEQSFECRTAGGALFYRHGGCPAVIGRENPKANPHARGGEKVTAHRISRAEACRNLRSVGRQGREYDEVTPTYDKNLGRDPCRRY